MWTLYSLFIGALTVIVVLYIFLTRRTVKCDRKIKQRSLLVTAHPDDECMFFAPTVLNLLKAKKDVTILCFTSGNHYDLGHVREKELLESCKILGIPESHIELYNRLDIQDGPDKTWDLETVADIILKTLEKYRCNTIITFDDYGVSGHPNHSALYNAVQYLHSNQLLTADCTTLFLKSVTIIEKYSSLFLSLPLGLLSADILFVSSVRNVLLAQKAMYAHRSQFVWFRVLYILFSKYMIINRLCTCQGKS